ncbi:MAG: EamA family transporter [Alphaproteobacteria bacterium GM202ARS2]|nr:EamA family transporter [Alphaproteobacteria bacterium GM202ARS2]
MHVNAALLLTVVLAWGLSWYAIAVQVGTIPVEASIAYRFILSGALLLAWCAVRKGTVAVSRRLHLLLIGMGMCLFSLNFVLIYASTAFIVSGLTSVVFATAALMGVLNVWLFDGTRPSRQVVAGASLGGGGLGALYFGTVDGGAVAGTVDGTQIGAASTGLLLALGGTYCFSLGNIVSTRVRGRVDFVTGTAWAMLCGGALAIIACLLRHGTVPPPPATTAYLGSLAYLVVGASVIGFLAYLDLVRRAGAAQAAYATVLFPLVALVVSSALEGYLWTPEAVLGVAAILGGAALVFVGGPKARQR